LNYYCIQEIQNVLARLDHRKPAGCRIMLVG